MMTFKRQHLTREVKYFQMLPKSFPSHNTKLREIASLPLTPLPLYVIPKRSSVFRLRRQQICVHGDTVTGTA